MKKLLAVISMILMIGLSGCIWCDDCGHHHDGRPPHAASHGGHHGPHHSGGHGGHRR